MEIGKPLRRITVEPVEDPVPRRVPVQPPQRKQQPAPVPRKPVRVPA